MKTPERVLHLITKLELGGAQINTLYTVEHLDSTRFQAWLASGPGGRLHPSPDREGRWHILPHLHRAIHPITDLKALIELIRLLKKLRPAILHTHSSKAGILGRIAARICRVPIVIHSVHGFPFSPLQPLLKRKFYQWSERLASLLTTHFIFVAEEDKKTAKRKHLIRENASVIRSGFPFDPFLRKENRSKCLEKFGIAADRCICGVIAPFKPQKGLFHLIEIAARVIAEHKNAVFLIAGDGLLRYRLETKIKEKGLKDHFFLPGFIPDIERAISCFDIGVSTALWEGLPQSLVQMRLKKVPLVVSDIPGNREVVLHGKNGFIADLFNYKDFAALICRLIEHPELRNTLGDYSHEDFSEWNAPVMVNRQEELYERLLQQNRPSDSGNESIAS